MGWYFTITEEMRALGLKGSDLIVFAIINGFSQKQGGCYYGGNELLADMAGLTEKGVRQVLHRMLESGHLKREPIRRNGKDMYAYSTGEKYSGVTGEFSSGVRGKKVPRTGEKYSPNNKDITETTSPKSNKTTTSFVVPSVNDVKQYAESIGHPEFESERFVNFYTATGWRLKGGQPIKNWQACARDWIRRDEERLRQAAPTFTSNSRPKIL